MEVGLTRVALCRTALSGSSVAGAIEARCQLLDLSLVRLRRPGERGLDYLFVLICLALLNWPYDLFWLKQKPRTFLRGQLSARIV